MQLDTSSATLRVCATGDRSLALAFHSVPASDVEIGGFSPPSTTRERAPCSSIQGHKVSAVRLGSPCHFEVYSTSIVQGTIH